MCRHRHRRRAVGLSTSQAPRSSRQLFAVFKLWSPNSPFVHWSLSLVSETTVHGDKVLKIKTCRNQVGTLSQERELRTVCLYWNDVLFYRCCGETTLQDCAVAAAKRSQDDSSLAFLISAVQVRWICTFSTSMSFAGHSRLQT